MVINAVLKMLLRIKQVSGVVYLIIGWVFLIELVTDYSQKEAK
jgi:hypothetical protein